MTASKYIKSQGLHDLQYVADKVGKHRDTINNWYHNNYALFSSVTLGEVVKALLPKAKGVWRCDEYDAVLIVDEDGIKYVSGIDALMNREKIE